MDESEINCSSSISAGVVKKRFENRLNLNFNALDLPMKVEMEGTAKKISFEINYENSMLIYCGLYRRRIDYDYPTYPFSFS